MLLPPTEFVLQGAVIALYLYDSALLLHANEGVLTTVGRSRWQVRLGSETFQWQGKGILLPNPLTPHRPYYRLLWNMCGSSSKTTPVAAPARSYGWLTPLTWLMAVALFVLLPLGLFTRFGDLMIVAALLCFYSAALGSLGYLWRQRNRFHCPAKRFVHLAFESLTCPPFALNMVRHLSLAQKCSADLAIAAQTLQSSADWERTSTLFIERLDDEINWAEDKADIVGQLRQQRDRLLASRNQVVVDESTP